MGGGSSKVCNYQLVTDKKVCDEFYNKADSRTPQKLKKGASTSKLDTSLQRRNTDVSNLKNKLKKGSSVASFDRRNTDVGSALKKYQSEKGINLEDKSSKMISSGKAVSSNGVVLSSRLPWLVKSTSLKSNTLGERIRYGRIIGRGLMGTVRVCELDKGTNKYVAVKSISKKYVLKHNDLRHVNAEKDVLALMTSPFCIRLFGTFQDNDYIHLVTEYAPGGELFRRLSRRDHFSPNVTKF